MKSVSDLICINSKPSALAVLKGSEKYPDICGKVFFYEVCEGILVYAQVSKLPKATGKCDSPILAFHIHSGNSCTGTESDPFADALSHYNPKNYPHPFHAGDLPPLFSAHGRAVSLVLTDRFHINEIVGRAIIIHASIDDFSSQPAGNAGEKIVCGVIKRCV